jgi:hypothetical protein
LRFNKTPFNPARSQEATKWVPITGVYASLSSTVKVVLTSVVALSLLANNIVSQNHRSCFGAMTYIVLVRRKGTRKEAGASVRERYYTFKFFP